MDRMIQIRHVPEAIHRRIKTRAAEEGLTLSDFLLREVVRIAEQPTAREVLDRLATLPPIRSRKSDAALVRAERDSR